MPAGHITMKHGFRVGTLSYHICFLPLFTNLHSYSPTNTDPNLTLPAIARVPTIPLLQPVPLAHMLLVMPPGSSSTMTQISCSPEAQKPAFTHLLSLVSVVQNPFAQLTMTPRRPHLDHLILSAMGSSWAKALGWLSWRNWNTQNSEVRRFTLRSRDMGYLVMHTT